VSKLGPEYSTLAGINQPRYERWSQKVEDFFKERGVTLTKTTNDLAVSDKVAGKKVDWAIDYKIPDPMTVTGADLTPINQVVDDFLGRVDCGCKAACLHVLAGPGQSQRERLFDPRKNLQSGPNQINMNLRIVTAKQVTSILYQGLIDSLYHQGRKGRR
jgi:hypothetical protein